MTRYSEKLRDELVKEQRNHDVEINRIAEALGLPVKSTIEDIMKQIKKILANQKHYCSDCGKILPEGHPGGFCGARDEAYG
jgi:rRNA maturation endonuclease Nob1